MPFELSAENVYEIAARSDAELEAASYVTNMGVTTFSQPEYDRLHAERQVAIDIYFNGAVPASPFTPFVKAWQMPGEGLQSLRA